MHEHDATDVGHTLDVPQVRSILCIGSKDLSQRNT